MASKQILFNKAKVIPTLPHVVQESIVQDDNNKDGKKGSVKPKSKPVISEEIKPIAENLNQYLIDTNDFQNINESIAEVDQILPTNIVNADSNEIFNSTVDQNLTDNDDLTD